MENNRKMENDSKIGVKEYVRMTSVGCVQEPQVGKFSLTLCTGAEKSIAIAFSQRWTTGTKIAINLNTITGTF